MAPVVQPAGAADDALVLIDATSGAGGLPVDVRRSDVYYFAPQKCFASDGGLWIALFSAALERSGIEQPPPGPARAGVLRPADRDRQLGERTRPTTPRGRHALPHGRAAGLDERRGGLPRRWSPDHRVLRHPLHLGREVAVRLPLRRRPGPPLLVIGTIDFDESIDAARIAAVLRANGVVDTEPTAALGRNQLRIAMAPAVDPTTSGAHALHRLVVEAPVVRRPPGSGPSSSRPRCLRGAVVVGVLRVGFEVETRQAGYAGTAPRSGLALLPGFAVGTVVEVRRRSAPWASKPPGRLSASCGSLRVATDRPATRYGAARAGATARLAVSPVVELVETPPPAWGADCPACLRACLG